MSGSRCDETPYLSFGAPSSAASAAPERGVTDVPHRHTANATEPAFWDTRSETPDRAFWDMLAARSVRTQLSQ